MFNESAMTGPLMAIGEGMSTDASPVPCPHNPSAYVESTSPAEEWTDTVVTEQLPTFTVAFVKVPGGTLRFTRGSDLPLRCRNSPGPVGMPRLRALGLL